MIPVVCDVCLGTGNHPDSYQKPKECWIAEYYFDMPYVSPMVFAEKPDGSDGRKYIHMVEKK